MNTILLVITICKTIVIFIMAFVLSIFIPPLRLLFKSRIIMFTLCNYITGIIYNGCYNVNNIPYIGCIFIYIDYLVLHLIKNKN